MTIRFLLDNNTISEPLRPVPDPGVLEKLRTHEAEIAVAAPVWHELWFGCERLRRSRRRAHIETFLRDVIGPRFPILAYDSESAAWHAAERARLAKRGGPPPLVDAQIAAIAAVNDLTLVTPNPRDHARFRDLEVVDWRSA